MCQGYQAYLVSKRLRGSTQTKEEAKGRRTHYEERPFREACHLFCYDVGENHPRSLNMLTTAFLLVFLVRIQTHHGMELYLHAAASSPRIQDRAAINDIQQIDGLAHAAAHHESSPNQKACVKKTPLPWLDSVRLG